MICLQYSATNSRIPFWTFKSLHNQTPLYHLWLLNKLSIPGNQVSSHLTRSSLTLSIPLPLSCPFHQVSRLLHPTCSKSSSSLTSSIGLQEAFQPMLMSTDSYRPTVLIEGLNKGGSYWVKGLCTSGTRHAKACLAGLWVIWLSSSAWKEETGKDDKGAMGYASDMGFLSWTHDWTWRKTLRELSRWTLYLILLCLGFFHLFTLPHSSEWCSTWSFREVSETSKLGQTQHLSYQCLPLLSGP